MADPKTKPTKISVTAFIAAVANETRRADAKTLLAMMRDVTGEKPVMWGPTIIGFGVRKYRRADGKEHAICKVGFSPRAANLVLYIAALDKANGPLLKRLGKYKTGTSCLYINKLADVDLNVLRQMIERTLAQPAVEQS
jgi:hypothetical protein